MLCAINFSIAKSGVCSFEQILEITINMNNRKNLYFYIYYIHFNIEQDSIFCSKSIRHFCAKHRSIGAYKSLAISFYSKTPPL